MTAQKAIKILSELHDQCCQADSIFCTDTTGARCEAVDMAISALRAQDVPGANVGSVISRQAAITEFSCCELTPDGGIDANYAIDFLKQLPSAQPEQSIAQERYGDLCEYFKDCSDQGRSILNDRKEFKSWLDRMKWHVMECDKLGRELEKLKSAQPETHKKRMETHACDLIDRQAAIDALHAHLMYRMGTESNKKRLDEWINSLPSAQPEPCEDAVSRTDVEHEIANILRGIFVEYQDIAKKTASKLQSVTPKRKTGKWMDAVLPNDNGGLPVEVCDQCNTFFPLAFTGGALKFCPNCGADMRGEQDG